MSGSHYANKHDAFSSTHMNVYCDLEKPSSKIACSKQF